MDVTGRERRVWGWVDSVAGRTAVNLLILCLWLWLYKPVFAYLQLVFQREDFRTNLWVLAGVLLLIGMQMRQEQVRPSVSAAPHLQRRALALVLVCTVAFLLAERFLDINMLSATLFALGSYGLLGLWLSPERWRRGLPAALLLIGVLPFGEHLQTFVGYPMRIVTADLVRRGLAGAGVASLGTETILVFENGVSHVDLPCSGVKSLWTGMLFLVAATWVERRQLNGRWLMVAGLFFIILFVVNLVRVALLVITGQVMGWVLLAEMLHVPLGVLGFVLACGAAVLLLRWLAPVHDAVVAPAPVMPTPRWLAPLLVAVLAFGVLMYAERPSATYAAAPPIWQFPAALHVEPLPLRPDEYEWLTRDGADGATRVRFAWGDLSGSMILITSQTWRGHHRPERCFEVYGLTLHDSRTVLVDTAVDTPETVAPVRYVSLGKAGVQPHLSATYWFQSAGKITDDYGTRIWSDVAWERDRWVLVSILFDDPIDPNGAEVQALYAGLQTAVDGYLSGGS